MSKLAGQSTSLEISYEEMTRQMQLLKLENPETSPMKNKIDASAKYLGSLHAATALSYDKALIELYQFYVNKEPRKAIKARNLLALRMYKVHCASFAEIAEAVNLSERTVKGIVKRLETPNWGAICDEVADLTKDMLFTRRLVERITAMVKSNQHLITKPFVIQQLRTGDNLHASTSQVTSVMVKRLGLVYRRVRSTNAYVNSDRNVELRQHATIFLAN